MAKLYQNKAWLYDRYVAKRKNIYQIAEECDTSIQVIQYWLEKYELIRKPRKWTK